MNRTFKRVLTLAVALPLALGACAEDEPEDADLEIDSDAVEEPMQPMAPVAIQLTAVGGSGITGDATALHEDDEVTVSLNLQGLMEDQEYEAMILPGTCPMAGVTTTPDDEAEDEMEDESIAELELDVEGVTGTAEATMDADELPATQDAHIAVTDSEGALLACGDIRGHGMDSTAPTRPAPPTADTAAH